MFVGREVEAAALQRALASGRPALLRVLGRRRLGKTRLVRQRIPDGVYLYIDESPGTVQLPRLARDIAEQVGAPPDARDWSRFFRSLADIDRVIVLDEFQRLLDADPPAVSALQDAWDNVLKPAGCRVVVCGSSIGMMQRLVEGKGAPLLGRFTGQLRIDPLPFAAVAAMHPEQTTAEAVTWFGIFGGTPYYQEHAVGKTAREAVHHAFLAPEAPLLDEPERLLVSELRSPALYSAILQAVGAGKRSVGEIADVIRKPTTTLPPYLRVLAEDLAVLRRDEPVLGPKRTARYTFLDPFFRFYYHFIHPSRSAIAEGLVAPLSERIQRDLPGFLGPAWETVVRGTLRHHANGTWHGLDLRVSEIGAYWDRRGEHEVDVVAHGPRHAILGTCKWRRNDATPRDLDGLRQAGEGVPTGDRTTTWLVAARSFSPTLRRAAEDDPALVLLGADDLQEDVARVHRSPDPTEGRT